jgi:hypothetical protein
MLFFAHVLPVSLNYCVQAGIMFLADEKEKKESKPLEKVQLKHLIIPFLILGVGLFVALVVFLIEMKGRKNEAQQAYDSNNQN